MLLISGSFHVDEEPRAMQCQVPRTLLSLSFPLNLEMPALTFGILELRNKLQPPQSRMPRPHGVAACSLVRIRVTEHTGESWCCRIQLTPFDMWFRKKYVEVCEFTNIAAVADSSVRLCGLWFSDTEAATRVRDLALNRPRSKLLDWC